MTDQEAYPDNQKESRPKLIALLAILVFGFSLFQLYSFIQVLTHWNILVDLHLALRPAAQATYHLVWGSTGILIALGLWTGKGWGRIGSLAYWILFSLSSWINLIWIAESSTLQTRWPVNLFFTILGLGALGIILNLDPTRIYFRKSRVKFPNKGQL